MPSSFILINAPLQVTATMAELVGAILSARPGAVITVPVAVAPFTLNLSGIAKSGYGVCVKLPSNQIVRITATRATSNIHFFGGKISADEVTGERLASNYGLSVESGCSKISAWGVLFGENVNSIVTNQASDIIIDTCRFTLSRADHAQTPATARMQMSNNAFDSGAKGAKFCYYPDGREPDHNISAAVCTANGGIWEDTAHNDIWQFRTGCADIIAINNNCNTFHSQGFVTFGSAGPEPLQRCLVADNIINDAASHGITIAGNDLEVRDNVVATSPSAEVQPRLSVTRSPADTGRVYGGRNTAPIITQPSGVDLESETLNGDVVNPPIPPAIVIPAWAPVYSLPAALPNTVPARIAGLNGLRPLGTPSVGDWLSVNRGQWTGVDGITWEYRWTRNGTPISGATSQVYQVVADDSGENIGVEVRGTNAVGTGDWYAYTSVMVDPDPAPFQSVNTNGWSATYSEPPTFDPVESPITATVTRQGFNASAEPVAVNDSLTCMARIRQPWPDQASLTTDQVALSEFVYASDTIAGVVNNSTLSYPLPIAHWMRHDKEIINSATYTARLCIAHAYARNGRPVAAVEFSATDGVTTVTSLVSSMSTIAYSASELTVPHFAGDLDFTSFTNGATITISAIIYPWVGEAFNIATDADVYPSPNLTTLEVLNNRTGAFGTAYAYVDAAGPGATPTVSADPAVAEANPYGTLDAAATALRAFNDTNYSRNFCDGGFIRLLEGTHIFSNPIRTPGPTSNWPVTIEAANPAAVATTILRDRGSTMQSSLPNHAVFRNIRIQRSGTGSFICYDNTASNLNYDRVMVFDGCSMDANDAGGYAGYIYRTGNCYFLNCSQIQSFSQASRLSTVNKAVKSIGSNGTYSVSTSTFAAIGCRIVSSSGIFSQSAAIAGVPETLGSLVAFSHLTLTVDGQTLFGSGIPTGARGFAAVGNVLEKLAGATSANGFIHADNNVNVAQNIVLIANTIVGSRLNYLYQDLGTETIEKRGFLAFNVGRSRNTKTDVFGANSNLVGNWSEIYNAGSRSNSWMRGSDQTDGYGVGSWLGEVRALGEVSGSDATPVNPAWVNDQSFDGGNAGGGDYTPGAGSELPTITAAMAPHSHDMLGRPYVEGSKIGAVNAL
jgi:hypothetical protein